MIRSYTIPLLILFHTSLFAQQTETLYLSGRGFDDPVLWEFFCTARMNSGKWTTIQVPSCWKQQGFGEYNSGHIPFDKRLKEEGHYLYRFMAEGNWKGAHAELVFEGVMTDDRVMLNGKQAWEVHRGDFYPFSCDVSVLLSYGEENLLEVFVKNYPDNMSVNQAERKADYWIFEGIFRPVWLEIRPREHIKGVAVDARADGTFRSDVMLSPRKQGTKVRVEILDPEGIEIARYSSETHGREEKVRIKYKGVNHHCFHPDHGRTSSKAFSTEVVNLIKDMNMNAVRMSHYLPDAHFLGVCDSLDLFVLDKLAGWQRPPYDSAVGRQLFGEMIARDVNHSCVQYLPRRIKQGALTMHLTFDFTPSNLKFPA